MGMAWLGMVSSWANVLCSGERRAGHVYGRDIHAEVMSQEEE